MTDLLRKAQNYIDDQLYAEDKQANRAKACFKSLEEEGIQICNPTTREVVTSITETLRKDKPSDYDTDHCLSAFNEIGLVNCDTLPKGFSLKINSNSCLDILKTNNIELCFNGSGARCTKSKFWEEEINNWTDQEPVELCKEQFKKYSLITCDDKTFNVSKCLNIFEKNNNKLYYRNEWLEINQENFDNFCCKHSKKDAPYCYAFSSSKEFNGEYNIENCQNELTGLEVYLLAEDHTEL